MLADGAEKNVKTWEFAGDYATTFSVTYRYRLTKNFCQGFIEKPLPSDFAEPFNAFHPLIRILAGKQPSNLRQN